MSIAQWRHRAPKIAFAVLLTMVLSVPAVEVFAQDDDTTVELDELKDERERIAREAAVSAQGIDVRTATVEEVTEALAEIAEFVEIQQIRLDQANQRYDVSLGAVDEAEQAREEVLAAADALRAHLGDLAVASFTGESGTSGGEVTELVLSDDPGESARFIHLLELQTGNLGDGLDSLRALEVEAQDLVLEQVAAAARAEIDLAEVELQSAELDEALEQQALIVASAELRLEAQLAETAFLAEQELQLATLIRGEQNAINERIISSARSQGVEIPTPVDLDNIVLISFYNEELADEPTVDLETGEVQEPVESVDSEPFFQIEVHVDIEEQTRALYELAFDQGIDLGGWGYRPIQRQVELRAAHCGGSAYDIWHKPAFECAPPTARPGWSKHEQGRAIDFQWNGGSIGPRSGEAFQWLAANAPQFGFVNLPSEPWHWSIDEGAELLPE